MKSLNPADVAVIGGGFTGLSAAYELGKRGANVAIFEADDQIGGLASSFEVKGERLDRFYHHWFTNDRDVMALIEELGLSDRVTVNPTNTGVYYANNFFRLSTPIDLLKFTPLPFLDRLRLGLLALRARRVKHWKELEDKTAAEWLISLGGEKVYEVIWEPLLKGKFGPMADEISAVWFWNKLKLRGGSRGKGGEEQLAYFKGGFAALAESIVGCIETANGRIFMNKKVVNIHPEGMHWRVETEHEYLLAKKVVITTALPLAADMVRSWAEERVLNQLERIQYLANICLVLELDRPLSKTYWLNINDPSFPFVGLIEHTNFEHAATYGGRHIVYLSKYLPHTDALYQMSSQEMLDFSLPHIQKMFPSFSLRWVKRHHVWKARWAQPVVEKNYSKIIPPEEGPKDGLYFCSMAQIYPEDRGTNYAIREGRRLGIKLATAFSSRST